MKILCVDDDLQIRTVLQKFLEAKGHQVVTAENGQLGVAAAEAEMPELIIMDINMPVMDGLKAVRTIKENADLNNIPIMMLTAEDVSSTYDAIYDAGADGYVSKPIDFAVLLTRVAQYG